MSKDNPHSDNTNNIARAIIQVDNLRHNLSVVRQMIGPDRKICLAVKANAYGHGLIEIAGAAIQWGVEWLCVVHVSEGVMLRRAGITCPILLISQPLPDEISTILDAEITPMVSSREIIQIINSEAGRMGKKCRVHLEIDTGMGRNGCLPKSAVELACKINESPHLILEGTATHFSVADVKNGNDYTHKQIDIFEDILRNLRINKIDPGIIHTANSGAIVNYPKSYYNMVRVGILAYGYIGDAIKDKKLTLKPVMSLESKVVFIKECKKGTYISYGMTYCTSKDTNIAVVKIGYGDGYRRCFSNNTEVLIKGKKFPVIGRICMDHLMVNIGKADSISINDPVILFGSQAEDMTAQYLAEKAGTIVNEILTGITQRVTRIYEDNCFFQESSHQVKKVSK